MKMISMPTSKRALGRFLPECSIPPVPPKIVALFHAAKYNLLYQVIPTALMFIVITCVFALATKWIVEAKPCPPSAVTITPPAGQS